MRLAVRYTMIVYIIDVVTIIPSTLGDIGNYYYGQGHPMKPHRIRMTHNLLLNYGLYRKMEIYRPHKATQEEMTKFHSDDYIRFLRSIRPDNMGEYNKQMQVNNEIRRARRSNGAAKKSLTTTQYVLQE